MFNVILTRLIDAALLHVVYHYLLLRGNTNPIMKIVSHERQQNNVSSILVVRKKALILLLYWIRITIKN